MRYIIRAVKYFVYVSVIVTLMLTVLAITGFVSSSVDGMFSHGWRSVGMIALMFAAVSAFYPRFGYTKRLAAVLGDLDSYRDVVVSYMKSRGYSLETEQDGVLTFRLDSIPGRILTRMLEDRITIEKGLGGFYVEGLAKDVARIVTGLEFKFENPDKE